jgi:hypothetical protein
VINKKQNLRVIDAPIYRYWQALYLAFFSRQLYLDVAKRWRGWGVLYMVLLIAIATLPLTVRFIIHFNKAFDEQVIASINELPPLYVQNGQIVIDKPMPYLVKNNQGDIVAIIDTTGKIKKMNHTYPKLVVLITKKDVYFRPPLVDLFVAIPGNMGKSDEEDSNGIFSRSLSKDMNEVFVGKEWVASSGILKLKWIANLLAYPLMLGYIFGLFVVPAFFFAFIGQLLSIIVFKFKLSFKDTSRLFLVAATPDIVVFFVQRIANITLPGQHFYNVVLLAAYFSFAVLSVRRESRKMVRR